MMAPAMPPAPPAIIRTLAEFTRQALGRGAGEPVTLGEVYDAALVLQKRVLRAGAPLKSTYRIPFQLGNRVKGRRDVSLRTRAKRRKQ